MAALTAVVLPTSFAAQLSHDGIKLSAKGKNYASYDFGDVKIVALRDGYVDMPPTRLRQTTGGSFGALPADVLLVNGQLRLSVNAFLVIDNRRSVLIDTGASNAWHSSMGALLDGLREAGIDRNSISRVALTHTHEDHANGLIAPDGTVAFPKAESIFVPKEEVSQISGRLAKLRDRVIPVGDNFMVSDRITAIRATGHSPGHTAYEVKSSAGTLLVWGDIIHVPSIQFGRPEITWEFDDNQPEARGARMAILERAAQPNTFVAGAHLDFPGIGRVTKRGNDFDFQGVD
ncbi:MBL fold metallo-hydrolase [Paraburkholderia nemoris]|nr:MULTISPECIES: MBL fold metallo-hydrolase [Paraburkholderia]